MILLSLWLITQSGLELLATTLATGASPAPASQD